MLEAPVGEGLGDQCPEGRGVRKLLANVAAEFLLEFVKLLFVAFDFFGDSGRFPFFDQTIVFAQFGRPGMRWIDQER